MNKIAILAFLALTLAACGGDKFTVAENPDPTPNELTGTPCDSDDPVTCKNDGCEASQYCENGEWGLCECESSGESGGSSSGGTESGGSDGTGGDVTTGGTDTGGSDGDGGAGGAGGDGTGGNTVCVPKTCDELSYDLTGEYPPPAQGTDGSVCGVHDDGCGGNLFCDTCNSPFHQCGGPVSVLAGTGTITWGTSEGTAGVCSGGCYSHGKYSYCSGEDYYVTCAAGDPVESVIPEELADKECQAISGSVEFCCKQMVVNN